MPHLDPDHPDVVNRIFDIDGASSAKYGFQKPVELRVFADDARPRQSIEAAVTSFGMPEAHAEAYARYLATGNEEIAFE